MSPNYAQANSNDSASAFDRRQPVYVDEYGNLHFDDAVQNEHQAGSQRPRTRVLPSTWGRCNMPGRARHCEKVHEEPGEEVGRAALQ